MPATRQPGCVHCRERHLRCDRAIPTCSNCRKARPPLDCVFRGIKIRHSLYSAKARATRIRVDHAAKETADALSSQGSNSRGGPHQSQLATVSSTALVPLQPAGAAATNGLECSTTDSIEQSGAASWTRLSAGHRSSSEDTTPQSLQELTSISPRTVPGGFDNLQNGYTVRSPNLDRSAVEIDSPNSNFSHRRRPSSQRMVTDDVERFVFQFYISHAGPWLDIVSSHRHFGQTVPRLALTEPVLYYACLAYASHVLFLKGELDEYVQEQFQNKAIGLLIPLLSPHFAPATDSALLATTVILRMSEQFSELADDAQHHLHGAYSLFATTGEKWSPFHIDVRGVAFWIYLRESIRVCFLNEHGCQFDLDIVDLEKTTSSAPEEVLANEISYLMARLCNACWGDLDENVKESMREEIQTSLEDWKAQLPDTFQPWCFTRKEYQPFPTMKFLSPWHEIAWQQYYTAKVMLAVYASKRREDSSILTLNQHIEAEIINPARLACSVCFSSDDIGCNINGTHLISWCGQFFTGKEEQRLLANFLKDFMNKTKWPNKTCYERLEQIWKGNRQTWSDP